MSAIATGLATLAGIGNGQSAESNALNYGFGTDQGSSWNNSESSSWGSQLSDAYGSAYGNSYGYGTGENWTEGASWGNGENRSWNAVYGSEASAKDVLRAAEANAQQEKYQKMQMDYNALEAQKVRDYEAEMSNTAYQRAVKDLKAAGLNPILAAFNMGASTPSVSAASTGLSSAYKANTFADQEGGSYGWNENGSYNKGYGYNRSENRSNYYSENRSHSEGNQGSRSWSHGGSENKGFNVNYGQSSSKSTNNLLKAIEGIADLFKTSKPAGFDGYDVPSVSH